MRRLYIKDTEMIIIYIVQSDTELSRRAQETGLQNASKDDETPLRSCRTVYEESEDQTS